MPELLPFLLLPPKQGAVELRASPEPRFLNTLNTVHGGWSMTMLDTSRALAAHTTLEAGELCPTLETSVKFIRPILGDSGELRILGHVISRSRTIITLEGRKKAGEPSVTGLPVCRWKSVQTERTPFSEMIIVPWHPPHGHSGSLPSARITKRV
ncbi:PaaI family thioesterase [Sinorhizobium sp. GL28]|uniref:PaaI family thioesterase n=1 Tax=Sinorhizobium sp. GL28 TaxID=1358418 RepID=UPI0009EAAFD8|nr:PaaI family thioesterase [Sinorhizobium sp. GL28]